MGVHGPLNISEVGSGAMEEQASRACTIQIDKFSKLKILTGKRCNILK
jgi:hypothetical protein